MEEAGGLAFDDEEVDRILANLRPFEGLSNTEPGINEGDWDELAALRRTKIKTALHGLLMSEYLKSKTAPPGLIVKNEPFIFTHDLEFKRDWSLISWKCTRDWLVLIVKTATKLTQELKIEITQLEVKIKSYLSPAALKKRLEELNQEMTEFECTLKKNKYKKHKKDTENFTHERIYPYIKKDHVSKNQNNDQDTDMSDTSSNGSNSSRNSNQSTRGGTQFSGRGYPRGGRGWGPYQGPPPFMQGPPGFMQYPPGPVFMGNQFPPWDQQMPPFNHYGQPPFLGQRQGTRKGRNRKGTQVHWNQQPAQPLGVSTRSQTASTSRGT